MCSGNEMQGSELQGNDLFGKVRPLAPLAEKLRPASLDEVVGQKHLLGPGKPLRIAFESGRPLGSAQVVCPTCGMVWEDEGPDFWDGVRRSGRLPTLCALCNSDLPQWHWRPRARRKRGQRTKA